MGFFCNVYIAPALQDARAPGSGSSDLALRLPALYFLSEPCGEEWQDQGRPCEVLGQEGLPAFQVQVSLRTERPFLAIHFPALAASESPPAERKLGVLGAARVRSKLHSSPWVGHCILKKALGSPSWDARRLRRTLETHWRGR